MTECEATKRAERRAILWARLTGIAPEILAAHAQFGGDLRDMQRLWDEATKAEKSNG